MNDPEVIYEEKDFIVINKPAGMQVHPARISAPKKAGKPNPANEPTSQRANEPTLVDWLIQKYPEVKTVGDDPATRPGIVHRLDKGTSGVMLVARTQEGFEYLKSLFARRNIAKTYLALVSGKVVPASGVINKPIGIINGTLKRSVRSEKMAKEAVTEYRVISNLKTQISKLSVETENLKPGEFSLLEVMPKTGRTHQIRVHLASIGHPIVGDKLYGPKQRKANKPISQRVNEPNLANEPTSQRANEPVTPRLMLHAASIEFVTKEGKRMRFDAEPPEGLRDGF